ncbi:ABC transporter ATP-binding protein [Nesterenkonia ebinurensis]|uniref:ABC transporter ATP-binding protein n=1 Tax=Nesterenkonia ebinurensis TaxID=2608252 RepID=UPI00123D23B6|nr:ABC transporter ATP-binding protein [Nesterenkonia ebinurensis]
MTKPLLSVRDLRVTFTTPSGPFDAVKDVSFTLEAGQTVAVVGESGSGKSTVAACINRLLADNGRISSGMISFSGRELTTLPEREMRPIRGAGIGLVPQDPMSNLNPVHTVGQQIAEALEVHGKARRGQARERVIELLEMVGIPSPEDRYSQFPHEFSGGMRQRVLIAMGLACEPELLIADEPTSALDVTVQRRILDRLGELTAETNTAVLLITHDLALAAERADRVLVMYKGELVESGPAENILQSPQHEYTRRLVSAAPSLVTEPIVNRKTTPSEPVAPKALAELKDVGRRYKLRGRSTGEFWAAREVSFQIPRGRTVAIVGESGSGKSTTAKMLLGLEDITEGSILIGGVDISAVTSRQMMGIRRQIQPVFQNPYASLDPRYTVAESIGEPLRVHRIGSHSSRRTRVTELLEQVALPGSVADRLPHELSGGQRQRVAIARALALKPELVVLDEAVSALDVLVQNQILELLVGLQEQLGLSYLFISHDLAVVNMISHQVHVMQKGRIVESGTPQKLFTAPESDYTKELLAAIPGSALAGAV